MAQGSNKVGSHPLDKRLRSAHLVGDFILETRVQAALHSPIVDGASLLTFIVGDPVSPLKSPETFTTALRARGINAAMLPAHVTADGLVGFFDGVRHIQNLRGCMITMPHKISAASCCQQLSERASFLGAVNIVRRQGSGEWFGDNLDGEGFMRALGSRVSSVLGKSAFLIGAGGVGAAIGYALLAAGLSRLRILDVDTARQNGMIERLDQIYSGRIEAADHSKGSELIINATPLGMKPDDPAPFVLTDRDRSAVVADVVTTPNSSLIAQARGMGNATVTGFEMLSAQLDLAIDFLRLGDTA